MSCVIRSIGFQIANTICHRQQPVMFTWNLKSRFSPRPKRWINWINKRWLSQWVQTYHASASTRSTPSKSTQSYHSCPRRFREKKSKSRSVGWARDTLQPMTTSGWYPLRKIQRLAKTTCFSNSDSASTAKKFIILRNSQRNRNSAATSSTWHWLTWKTISSLIWRFWPKTISVGT